MVYSKKLNERDSKIAPSAAGAAALSRTRVVVKFGTQRYTRGCVLSKPIY